MSKNLIPFFLLCIIIYSCSKSGKSENGPQNNSNNPINIVLVSGSNQTDTIGKSLQNPVIVKVTQNGMPLNNYIVQFQGSGCSSDYIVPIATKSDGTASYDWPLAGDVGQQTLKAFVLNSQNQKVDSVTATATGLATGPGWHSSACSIPFGFTETSICKLSTGVLFTNFTGGKAYLRSSTDNGASWYAVKSLGNTHEISWILSSPSDELFAFASGEATFYSNNAGQSWTTLAVPPFAAGNISSAVCTPTGKLLITTTSALYFSLDKGQTWTTLQSNIFIPPNSSGAGDADFNCPTEDQSGNLYVVGQQSATIYKSTNSGQTWNPLAKPNENDFSFYIDNNNWFYKGRSEPGTGGIYISKDNGVTYNQLISYSDALIDNMSLQTDGNFYYEYLGGQALYRAVGVSNSVEKIFNYEIQEEVPYIVAKNNNIITINVGAEIINYYTQ